MCRDKEHLESFMMEVPITQSIDLQNKSMDWFLYYMNFRHERINAIHWDIFLDYDKIIDIYASKYQRMMLLSNPLSKN